jgi:hypothetical protein
MKVSWELLKHPPKLGHLASLQTVFTLNSESKRIRDITVSPGKSCLNQAGSLLLMPVEISFIYSPL